MSLKSVVSVVVVAGVMVVGAAGSAAANVAWCFSDPPVQVVTPAGTHLTVNTTVAVAPDEAGYLHDVVETASASADGAGGTIVTIQVQLPSGISIARIASAVNRYRVATNATGKGGTIVTLRLDVPAA